MHVIHLKKELQLALETKRNKNHSIGFVPTMGALHDGHISLVNRAVEENDSTVVSIFINPTQFDNKQDLEKYPSLLEKDVALLKKVSKEVIVFAPSALEIYDGHIASKEFNFDGLEKVMEGAFRTGHFNGVATIVELLLNTVNPNRAYFGEKDFQQLQIIRKLVQQKEMPFEIISCPIEREPNGLARSSRNERLSESIRYKSSFIHKTLKAAKKKFGTESAKKVMEFVKNEFKSNDDFELEYFQIADTETLTPVIKKQENIKYRAFIAVYAEGIRLIDNIAL